MIGSELGGVFFASLLIPSIVRYWRLTQIVKILDKKQKEAIHDTRKNVSLILMNLSSFSKMNIPQLSYHHPRAKSVVQQFRNSVDGVTNKLQAFNDSLTSVLE